MAETEKIKKPVTDEIAGAEKDIDIFSGWLTRRANPDPVLSSEAGGKGLKLYDEIARDAHAGSVLQTRFLTVVGKEIEVIPADDSSRAQEAADLVESALLGCNFGQAVGELLQAVLYGFYVAEVMWRVKDGRATPRKIVAKHPRRFVFDMERSLRLLTPDNMVDGIPVPDRKFIVFTYGSSDSPYGCGLGQKLWWPVWFKKNGIKFWLIFLEKFGAPTPVGKYPPGTEPEQQQKLLDAIDAIQTETGIKIPESMSIDLLEATRGGNASYETMCEYMDRQISKAVLGQTASTEGTPGKLGNDRLQENVRDDITKADADLLCECLNNTLVRWIVDYNVPDPDRVYPRLWIRTDPEKDLKALAERDRIILVDMGMAGRVPESYISDTYGIPLAADGEATILAAKGSVVLPDGKALVGGEFSDAPSQAKPDPADMIAERLGEESMEITDEAFMAPIKRLVESAGSLEEIRDGILNIYGDLSPAELGELIARGMMIAEAAGRIDVKTEQKER